MKKYMAALAVFFCSTALHAQSPTDKADDDHFFISFTFGASFPTGSFKTTNKAGFSGRLNLDFDLVHKLRWVLVSGSASYSGKSYNTNYGYSDSYGSYLFVPVNVGLKYFFVGDLFVEGQAGVLFSLSEPVKGVGFNYSPSLGYELGGLDFSVRYDTYNIKGANLSAATVSASYGF
jgi:hypothetical protein